MDIKDILLKVKEGQMTIEDAEGLLKVEPFVDMGFAKVDTHRKVRSGFPEVVYCQGKADEHLLSIFKRLVEEDGRALGTRATKEQFDLLAANLYGVEYDPISRIVSVGKGDLDLKGNIAVCCAGTADIPVAEEAAQVAEYFGTYVERVYDVGVSGIHRLISKADVLSKANCIVAVAGMEGALASGIGGLVSCPVIAVPTSVGYGASFGGVSALLTMINTCANGVAVVNIDNGFGAGFMATQINRLAIKE